MPVKIVALVTVAAGRDADFEAAAATVVAASRAEPGVLTYEVWREREGERRYVFNELYADQDAVSAHMASDHFKAFAMAGRDLAAGRPTLIVCDAVDAGDAAAG